MKIQTGISKTAFYTFALFMSVIQNVYSSEKIITTVYNEESQTKYNLIVEDKDGRSMKGFYKDVYLQGSFVRRDVLDPKALMDSGLVLEQRDKHIIMMLKSINFDLDQGGIVTIDTLYNGAKGERKGYEVQIAQSKAGWTLFKNGQPVKEIYIKTNKIIVIGAVGIKDLVMK